MFECYTLRMDESRELPAEKIEGEIGLVIDYKPGVSRAVDVLQAAMDLVHSLDRLDNALLSSVDTHLEPVSILNDVQHSSLKMLLSRALKKVPDDLLGNLDWKKWVGGLLVQGKYVLLQHIGADAPEIKSAIEQLDPIYKAAPSLVGYQTPKVQEVQQALDGVARARARLPGQAVVVQTEFGDVHIPDATTIPELDPEIAIADERVNKGREFLKVKTPDMIGQAQWVVIRNNRATRVEILHKAWLDDYHARKVAILPGDSLDCEYEETVYYDDNQDEIDRKLAVIEVYGIKTPPVQTGLL